ncbi:MAG: hypothetical protein ACW98D_03785 [Promethearchaeota archaeon]|jgi:hypothetical protein
MRKKFIVLLTVFAFLNVTSLSFFVLTATARTTEPVFNEPLRIGDKMRTANYGINEGSAAKGKGSSSTEVTDYTVVDTKEWLSLNDWEGYYFFDWFELWDVGVGTDTEIWIQQNRSWSDPDPQRRSYPVITGEQVATLLAEFEGNIVPTVEAYYGVPDTHDGTYSLLEAWGYVPPGYYYSPTGKNVVLVSNIRDENYYTDFPYYIAGFYSPTFEGYFDRNIISIDSYEWEERVGSDGDRPYLYEGVIAHEYQHLIHDDFFTPNSDASFMNEGCSMFAEFLCGYPTAWGDINSFLATPDNSLTVWGDQEGINILADYGAALLWATYLNDVVSGTFLQEYMQAGWDYNGVYAGGVELLDYLLGLYSTDFETLFKAWRLANLMGTGYTSIDWDARENDGVHLSELKEQWPTDFRGTDLGNTFTVLGYDTGISSLGSYGTDYVLLSKLKWQYETELQFNGDEVIDAPSWIYDGDWWYSTSSDPLGTLDLFLEVTLTGSSILTIDTMYVIEDHWDFGFVQISTDDGLSWTSLSNEFTSSDDPWGTHPDIVANFPGLTGNSGGWMTMDFDLPEHTGDAIIRFRYMNDWGYQDPGWWIDNIKIDGIDVDDGFLYIPDSPTTSFLVTIIRQDFWEGEYYYSEIADLTLDILNDGILDLAVYLEPLNDEIRKPDVLLLVTPRLGPADYSLSVVPT